MFCVFTVDTCNDTNCSVCLRVGNEYTCSCPDGLVLVDGECVGMWFTVVLFL